MHTSTKVFISFIIIILVVHLIYQYLEKEKEKVDSFYELKLTHNQLPKINNTKIIPKNIFMTWCNKDLPPMMKNNLQSIKISNPDFNLYLYCEEDRKLFIQDYFDESVLKAYETLIPGAYKADLWRLCVLYIYGGIYMDMRFKIDGVHLNSLLYDEHFVNDISASGSGICNGFMVCKPSNIFLLHCISQILINVKNKYYGHKSLCPTGPLLLKNVMENHGYKLNLDLKLKTNPHRIVSSNKEVKVESFDEYTSERKKHSKNHYNNLWLQKKIYK